VCAEYCRSAHGIPTGTWNKLLASARAGKLQAGIEWDAAGEELGYADLNDSKNCSRAAKEVTVEWWVCWLTTEDQMPNEPVIVHRVVVWESVYELEYLADMASFGVTAPLSRSRWRTLQSEALIELSIEWFGVDTAGQPLAMLSLASRAAHSNFAMCHICAENKEAWVAFRTRTQGVNPSAATALDARALKAKLQVHVLDCKAQRNLSMRLSQEP
jgi:hypothetical protein